MTKRKQYLLIIVFLLVASAAASFIFMWHRALYAPMLVREAPTSVKLYPGQNIHALAKTLQSQGLISHPHIFVFAARLSEHAKKLRFGEYIVLHGMSASDLLNNIILGRGLMKHQITFVEGWTFQDVIKVLEDNVNLFHRLRGKTDSEIMQLVGQPNLHPEGLFLPETYTFIWGNTDIEILRLAYYRMQDYLNFQWNNRAKNLPYKNSYQALIVASLIEKETQRDNERPIVASVILHRLEKRMRLQVDPTVLYGLKKPFGTPITRQDLQSKTPYNTYQMYGLPLTPIDIPSRASIDAALHPANTNYLYYVSKGDGSHIFSENYHEHLLAVKKYRAWQKLQSQEDKV